MKNSDLDYKEIINNEKSFLLNEKKVLNFENEESLIDLRKPVSEKLIKIV